MVFFLTAPYLVRGKICHCASGMKARTSYILLPVLEEQIYAQAKLRLPRVVSSAHQLHIELSQVLFMYRATTITQVQS